MTRGRLVLGLLALAVLGGPAPAAADAFLPHPPGAQWTYVWTDTTYNPQGTLETVTVPAATRPAKCGWQLAWTGVRSGSGGAAPASAPDTGTMCFRDESFGLLNSSWSGSLPPSSEPGLCAPGPGTACANSLGSVLYDVIWGGRSPVLSEPLLQGLSWGSKGGADGSVSSTNAYLGLRRVAVPAFPHGVTAAVVRSEITLAGTPGDDYGSGTRTTWWVRGVGPVRLEFDHVDGSVTRAELQSTNQVPAPVLPDQDFFPLRLGLKGTYRWTNAKHLRTPEVETVKVAAVVNRSARITARSVSGPLRAAGDYVFSDQLDGLRTTYGSTAAATLITFPHLGHRRHFFTPVDLMTYGFNPVLPPYPVPGTVIRSGNARDFRAFGVTGKTRILGLRTVSVPAGRFRALEVRSVLSQRGSPFGSGVRTMWFAAGRGLVKLIFAHRDHSTSVVTLVR